MHRSIMINTQLPVHTAVYNNISLMYTIYAIYILYQYIYYVYYIYLLFKISHCLVDEVDGIKASVLYPDARNEGESSCYFPSGIS